MSLAAMTGGALLYVALQKYLSVMDGPPVIRHLDGQRIFDNVMVFLSWRAARAGADLLGTRRLQPQLRALVCVALVAALWPLYQHGSSAVGPIASTPDPVFALLWAIGIVCAV